MNAMDTVALLTQAYEVGDLINASSEVALYLHWKQVLEQSKEVQHITRKLQQKREIYDDCQRFGHFHPDYHAAMGEVEQVERELNQLEVVQQFKKAEEELDELLYQISETIAHAVSNSIKVPSNKLIPSGGGCSGGSCSGKCS